MTECQLELGDGDARASFFRCKTHRELVRCMADVYDHVKEWPANKIHAYVEVLQRIPLQYVGLAAVEIIGSSKWMPMPAEWRESAVWHWHEAMRAKRLSAPRLTVNESPPMTSGEFRSLLAEMAAAGNAGARKALKALEIKK